MTLEDVLTVISGYLGETRDVAEQVEAINAIARTAHAQGPFRSEPVGCVQWVPADAVRANDYNPNSVAPPEMRLLEHSITEDGYTQPIVTWTEGDGYEVIDGFHRHRVGKESMVVRGRVKGYLPVVVANAERSDRMDRMASTIRHNRARGKHKVESMSEIVVELKRRNWPDEKISRELGMDQDEVLRLCQITGLAEMFADQQFSKAWDVEGHITEDDFRELTDNAEDYGDEAEGFRAVNTNDESRIFHTYESWECHKAGFYATTKDGMNRQQCEEEYRNLLTDEDAFSTALHGVITEWKHSCEHYLTNVAMNRIAWLGQASLCYAKGIPSCFRGGFSLLTEAQQEVANNLALVYLNRWLTANGRPEVTLAEAMSNGRQSDIY